MTKINLEYYSQIIKSFILKHRIYILLFYLFFDGIYGLRFNAGIFSFGNIISGDLLWITQIFQVFFSVLSIIYFRYKVFTGISRNLLLSFTPIILFIVVIFAIDNLLKFNGNQAVFNFNISSTTIRQAIKSENHKEIVNMIDSKITQYIKTNKLYV